MRTSRLVLAPCLLAISKNDQKARLKLQESSTTSKDESYGRMVIYFVVQHLLVSGCSALNTLTHPCESIQLVCRQQEKVFAYEVFHESIHTFLNSSTLEVYQTIVFVGVHGGIHSYTPTD